MTIEEVQALVGPPRNQMWRYEWPNEEMTVWFAEGRAWSFDRTLWDARGKTFQSWSHDDPHYATRFAKPVTGLAWTQEWEDQASTLPLPVAYGDSPDKVMKVCGPPIHGRALCLAAVGQFRDGKLIAWFTTPQPAVV
jgi:hypothetical protein